MKRACCMALAAVLLLTGVLFVTSCADQSRIPDGTYVPENEAGDRYYVFSKDLLVFFRVIENEVVELHYTYELKTVESPSGKVWEELVLHYEGLKYEGRNPNISYYLTAIRYEYQKNPTTSSKIVRGDGYIEIDGAKFVKQ